MDSGNRNGAKFDKGAISTDYSADMGRRLLFLAVAVALALGIGFVVVHHLRARSEAQLVSETEQNTSEGTRVDVVT
jgi:uncharacterized protein HemX